MRRINPHRLGLSLIETTFATVLVSILMVASLSTISHVVTVANQDNDPQTAAALAQMFAAEICGKAFVCPECGTETIGLESGEGSIRSVWDDCDDYHGLALTSIRDEDGANLSEYSGWILQVTVQFVDSASPMTPIATPTDLKLITLTLTSPAGESSVFRTLRSRYGALQEASTSDNLAGIDVSLRTPNDSRSFRARPLNQLEF